MLRCPPSALGPIANDSRLTPCPRLRVQRVSSDRPEYREITVCPFTDEPGRLFVWQTLDIRIRAQDLDAVAFRVAQSAATKEDNAALFAIQEFQHSML